MVLQNVVWTVWLVGAALIALGFIFVIVQAGKPADDEQTRRATHKWHVAQAWAFGVLFVAFAVGSWATLRNFPIPPQSGDLDAQQVVNVVGRQWSWDIKPATVKAGSVVEFRVTSDDVNHGFALYAPDGRIVTQTQAMPGYTNKLLYTFKQPGTYTVRCLEYCGLMHAEMTHELDVVAAGSGAAAESAAATAVATAAKPSGAELGAKVYGDKCAVCHQANGEGMPNVFPPLAGDPVVTAADAAEHIKTVLHGTHGRVINGKTYAAQMPGWASQLTDEEVAAVINHERTSWGNHAPTVTTKDVAALRNP
ncbi:MAG TPA: c-type cytochrome [Rhodanobacteraceae bacterium]|jgi:cytochrome c oxidase subunit 2|nr:c-type cytochrome [Rhodanobacteraceae bacterium]